MMGNASARHNLGSAVGLNGNMDRALRHYMIAVGGGYAESLTAIQKMHSTGLASKEEYNTGNHYNNGLFGFPRDYTKALELYHHRDSRTRQCRGIS